MTSDFKHFSNRLGDSESTVAKSDQGKSKTSQNARKHGLTGLANREDVLAWVKVILGRADLGPQVLFSTDPIMEAAIALARAEVRRVRAEVALNEFEAHCERLQDHPDELAESAKLFLDFVDTGTSSRQRVGTVLNLIRYFETQTALGAFYGGPQHRLLKRYLREAQTGRSSALKAWVEVKKPNNEAA